jgi:hypothetical protein
VALRVLTVPIAMTVVLGFPLAMSLGIRDERPTLLPPGTARTTPAATVVPSATVAPPPFGAAAPATTPATAPAGDDQPDLALGADAAKVRLQRVAETARAVASSEGRGALDLLALAGALPTVLVVDGDFDATAAGEVSALVTGDVVALAAPDGAGGCWFLVDRTGRPRAFGRGTPCTGTTAVTASAAAW